MLDIIFLMVKEGLVGYSTMFSISLSNLTSVKWKCLKKEHSPKLKIKPLPGLKRRDVFKASISCARCFLIIICQLKHFLANGVVIWERIIDGRGSSDCMYEYISLSAHGRRDTYANNI